MRNFTIQKLYDSPYYTEGPCLDGEGNLYFTTLAGQSIGKLDVRGRYLEWSHCICPNGQVILEDGSHLVCDSLEAAIKQFDSSGKFQGKLLAGSCAGKLFTCPNDLIVDSNENIYFTDSVRDTGAVFFRSRDGKEKVIAEYLDYPNGLALSQDEKQLYVAESYRNRILKIALSAPGITAGQVEIFPNLPSHSSGENTHNLPDGMAIDHDGMLWVAHYGMQAIQVLSEQGELCFSVETGLPLTSNLCFIQDSASVKKLLVTGGYAEPGPGAVLLITVYI